MVVYKREGEEEGIKEREKLENKKRSKEYRMSGGKTRQENEEEEGEEKRRNE